MPRPEATSEFDMQEVILLGICALRPTHGYEARRVVEQQFEPFTPVNSRTVYYTLSELHEQGYLQQRLVASGSHPPKQVFRITAKGRKRLRTLLKASLYQADRPFFAFDLGLYFIHFLGYEEMERGIRERLQRIAGYQAYMAGVEAAYPDLPFNIRMLKERSRLFVQAAREFYEELLSAVTEQAERDDRPAPGPETLPLALDFRVGTGVIPTARGR